MRTTLVQGIVTQLSVMVGFSSCSHPGLRGKQMAKALIHKHATNILHKNSINYHKTALSHSVDEAQKLCSLNSEAIKKAE